MRHLHTDRIEADGLSCVAALTKAELLQNLFLRSSGFSSLLPVLEKLGCWWRRLLASHWSHSLAPVMAVWAVSKAWRCIQACTSVHNCAQSLLFPGWDRLWKNEATGKPRRASAFSCCELVSKLSLWIPLMLSFASISLKILQQSLPLDPYLTGDLEIITPRLCLYPWHQFKALGIFHPLKKLQGSTVDT